MATKSTLALFFCLMLGIMASQTAKAFVITQLSGGEETVVFFDDFQNVSPSPNGNDPSLQDPSPYTPVAQVGNWALNNMTDSVFEVINAVSSGTSNPGPFSGSQCGRIFYHVDPNHPIYGNCAGHENLAVADGTFGTGDVVQASFMVSHEDFNIHGPTSGKEMMMSFRFSENNSWDCAYLTIGKDLDTGQFGFYDGSHNLLAVSTPGDWYRVDFRYAMESSTYDFALGSPNNYEAPDVGDWVTRSVSAPFTFTDINICGTGSTSGAVYFDDIPDDPPGPIFDIFAGRGALVDQLAADPALQSREDALVASAQNLSSSPITQQATTYAELGVLHGTWLDPRAANITDPQRREMFALASGDCVMWDNLLNELPVLAAGYRITGEQALRSRIVSQFWQAVGWDPPMQRPGWSLVGTDGPIDPNYNDGFWLGTGVGIRALTHTLDILPEGELSSSLEYQLYSLLEAEVVRANDDYVNNRSCFNGTPSPGGNQWILPVAGWVEATVAVGRDIYPTEYSRATSSLMLSLDAQGPQGEFAEGPSYAAYSVKALLSAAAAMSAAGDQSAIEHDFLQKFPEWLASHFQPGNFIVAAGDAGRGQVSRDNTMYRSLFSEFVGTFNNPTARWMLENYLTGPSDDLVGAIAAGSTGESEAPPLWSNYEVGARVTWRSSWEDDASGFWLRGGGEQDAHDHHDRGHVNFIVDGKPILIEASTTGHGNPGHSQFYASLVGHNVLEIADGDGSTFDQRDITEAIAALQMYEKSLREVAPITLNSISENGGSASVDVTACYPELDYWTRDVTWNDRALLVEDSVVLPEEVEREEYLLFRWHLGTIDEMLITPNGDNTIFTVDYEDALLTFTSSQPIDITVEMLQDNTVNLGDPVETSVPGLYDYFHKCLYVKTLSPVKEWDIQLYLLAKPLSTMVGDANGDNVVDGEDAAILAGNWLQTGVIGGYSAGDFNEDGTVDDHDATILAANWNPAGSGGTATVPEPSAMALLLAGLVGLLAYVGRNKRQETIVTSSLRA